MRYVTCVQREEPYTKRRITQLQNNSIASGRCSRCGNRSLHPDIQLQELPSPTSQPPHTLNKIRFFIFRFFFVALFREIGYINTDGTRRVISTNEPLTTNLLWIRK